MYINFFHMAIWIFNFDLDSVKFFIISNSVRSTSFLLYLASFRCNRHLLCFFVVVTFGFIFRQIDGSTNWFVRHVIEWCDDQPISHRVPKKRIIIIRVFPKSFHWTLSEFRNYKYLSLKEVEPVTSSTCIRDQDATIGCYHSTRKTHVTHRILIPIHASMIQWFTEFPFNLGKLH